MKNSSTTKLILLLVVFASSIAQFSCKNESVVNIQTKTDLSKVSLDNGRIKLADETAYDNLLNQLSKKNTTELENWEKDLSFSSLRSQLSKDESLTNETNSLKSFGFPDFLASVINEKGEYQVGNKISWYHEGYRYVAENDEELREIKKNPLTAKRKYEAGYRVVKNSVPNAKIMTNGSGRDARYQKEIYYSGNPNSLRKFIYEVYVFTEEKQPDIAGFKKFYSVVYLPIKLEWKGRGDWANAGERRTISYNIVFSGNCTNNLLGSNPTFNNVNFSATNLTQNSNHVITLGSGTLYNTEQWNSGLIIWDFTVSGSISSYITDDNLPSNTYTVSSSSLW